MSVTLEPREFVRRGIYSFPDAARLLRERRDTIQRWALGYKRAGVKYSAVIDIHLPEIGGRHAVTFLELVELLTVREFRKAKCSWNKIRATFEYVAKANETEYPFALERWFADQAGIYYPAEDGDSLVEASGGGQVAMKAALLPYLRQLDFDFEGMARRWYPLGKSEPVVIDPEVAFGAPVVAGTGIQTSVLAGMAASGETPESLAWWYEISITQVDAALRYERSLAA